MASVMRSECLPKFIHLKITWEASRASFWTPIFDTYLLELISWELFISFFYFYYSILPQFEALKTEFGAAQTVWNQVCTIWIRSDGTQQQQLLRGNNCQFDTLFLLFYAPFQMKTHFNFESTICNNFLMNTTKIRFGRS